MSSIVKTILGAAIVLGSISLAPQAFAAHRTHHHSAYGYPEYQTRDSSLNSLEEPGPAQEEWFDRATQSFGGGK
jgi:hypothetical protein